MLVVDLPGYGYAAAPKAMVEGWRRLVGDYLQADRQIRLALLLIDIRRGAQREEMDLTRWLTDLSVPFLVVATKADKLPLSRTRQALKKLGQELGGQEPPMAFSSMSGQGREALITMVTQLQCSAMGLKVI